ncbi:CD225/dispanin family protein [Williamsia sp. CHRR-6]|uniref:CD225/dispanin family protein n=1 Tax=Williamsia sp. CHRR-6 TaxID=2835871 RepID=UPI001BDA1825|nr:CD225/dispanin family protein [Williamsia sp. CHRR-6]MBT0567415.1 CD225/dispanin family protein [Williamsia sp. CHRR-6]
MSYYDTQYDRTPGAGSLYGPPASAPKTNGGWAAATLIFFWPLAFMAFSRALSVPMLWSQGRYAEAEAASHSVARLGKIALTLWIILVAAFIVLYVVAFAAMLSIGSTLPDQQ